MATEPQYYDLLCDSDKESLKNLQKDISDIVIKSGKAKFCDIFERIIGLIHDFVVKGNDADNLRSLVCGIIWMEDDIIAINTRQLILIINKCKSSVNSGFQAIGYSTVQMDPKTAVALVKRFPFMKENFCETRQWTLRKLNKDKHTQTLTPKVVVNSTKNCVVPPIIFPANYPQKTEKMISFTPIDTESLSIESQKPKIAFTDLKTFPSEKKLSYDIHNELLANFDLQFDNFHFLPTGESIDDLSDPSSYELMNFL